MVGQHAEAVTIQHHRTPQRLLGGFQFTDDLLQAYQRVLLLKHIGEVMLNRTQQLHQGPGSTASLVEHVVDFQPGRCLAKLSAGRQRRAPHTGRQALRHGAKTGADIPYPAGEVVCTGVEVRLTALQAFDIAVE